MIWWPWLIAAFGAGLALGVFLAVFALIDLKMRTDDARTERGDYRL